MVKKIFIAGHQGMVGRAIKSKLVEQADSEIVVQTRNQLDLLDQKAVEHFFKNNQFNEVYIAAAKVGGIWANNQYPAEFIYQNLTIQNNLIHYAHLSGVQKLLFLGSSCIYPRLAPQPIKEESLLNGYLEPTNEPYAIAKIAGIKLCESYNRQYGRDYRSVMPTNLYGPFDNFHAENSHVIPGLIARIHQAKEEKLDRVIIWGSGKAYREFMYVDDMAEASIHVMGLPEQEYRELTTPMLSHINIGTGEEVSITELAQLIVNVVGFEGEVLFDTSKPEGVPRKRLDISRIQKTGWKFSIKLRQGLDSTYQWYLKSLNS
ncbi:GDP-L-fucose synthase family protein [Aliikangiella sp. IMCC44359]|uniref:GDP-L-fucose synthase family protein n=1 Tax=Aliikangiella sp. IMCC44359 TaxID=3459125 RepID=UPI00403AE682